MDTSTRRGNLMMTPVPHRNSLPCSLITRDTSLLKKSSLSLTDLPGLRPKPGHGLWKRLLHMTSLASLHIGSTDASDTLSDTDSISSSDSGCVACRRYVYITPDHKKQQISRDISQNADCPDVPQHDFTPEVRMLSLSDGVFTAELPLEKVAQESLCVTALDNQIDISVGVLRGRSHGKKYKRRERRVSITVPYHLGVVNLPPFVNPDTVELLYDLETDVLCITAHVKGFLSTACVNKKHKKLLLK